MWLVGSFADILGGARKDAGTSSPSPQPHSTTVGFPATEQGRGNIGNLLPGAGISSKPQEDPFAELRDYLANNGALDKVAAVTNELQNLGVRNSKELISLFQHRGLQDVEDILVKRGWPWMSAIHVANFVINCRAQTATSQTSTGAISSAVALPRQQSRPETLPQNVEEVLMGLRGMAANLKADYASGDVIELPRLCMSTATGGTEPIVYRDCFKKVLKKTMASLDDDGTEFEDDRRIFVHGPKGIGKSNALRYTVARLWAKRLNAGDNATFRVLYIAKWHAISSAALRKELQLCFYDDPAMLSVIAGMEINASTVQDLLSDYIAQRLIIVIGQVSLGDGDQHVASMVNYFPRATQNCKVVFASSPRFDLQGALLAGPNDSAVPLPFMDPLTSYECLVVARQLCGEMQPPTRAAKGARFAARKAAVLEQLNALPNTPATLEQLLGQARQAERIEEEDALETKQVDVLQRSAAATLLRLQEVSGGVPWYLRQMFLKHLPLAESVGQAIETFNANLAKEVRKQLFTHYQDLKGLPNQGKARVTVGYLMRFLQSAIGHRRAVRTQNHDDWQSRDLRYVRLHDDLKVEPLCPAALQGMVRFMLEVALTSERDQRSALLDQLQEALAAPNLPPTAVRFIKEGIFLRRLAGMVNRAIPATISSDANPDPQRNGQPDSQREDIEFVFDRVVFVDGFAFSCPDLDAFYTDGSRVLFLPRNPNEQYIDAAMFDYHAKRAIGIQVTGQCVMDHQDSLDYFGAASGSRWQKMINKYDPGEAARWEKIMVWVLTNNDPPGAGWPDDREVQQCQIGYETFDEGIVVNTGTKRPRPRDTSELAVTELTVGGCKVEQLRSYCRKNKIPCSGNKQPLINRIREHNGWAVVEPKPKQQKHN